MGTLRLSWDAVGWRRPSLVPVLLMLDATAVPAPVPQTLRVGTSGDYAPFSISSGGESGQTEGFSVAIARAYAEERGLALEFVPFRWSDLIPALDSGRFDVAISGVTVRPERSAAGRFTVPVVETGAVLLVRQPERWSKVEDLDRGDVRSGVTAGGQLERGARERCSRAVLVSIRDNLAVRTALVEENLHAAVTDTLEAPIWLRATQGLAVIGPFTRDRKAILVRRDRPALAADLNDWLMARERDGSLAAFRRSYLGEGAGRPVATALGSLLAAIDERLALMPLVGVAKRRAGLPLEVPEREELRRSRRGRPADRRRGPQAVSDADGRGEGSPVEGRERSHLRHPRSTSRPGHIPAPGPDPHRRTHRPAPAEASPGARSDSGTRGGPRGTPRTLPVGTIGPRHRRRDRAAVTR